jgi:hypothetical protein
LKVEYVVKPPMTPVVSMSRSSGDIRFVARPTCMMAPRRKEPTTFTVRVA